jgi:hypothetical protein
VNLIKQLRDYLSEVILKSRAMFALEQACDRAFAVPYAAPSVTTCHTRQLKPHRSYGRVPVGTPPLCELSTGRRDCGFRE